MTTPSTRTRYCKLLCWGIRANPETPQQRVRLLPLRLALLPGVRTSQPQLLMQET